MTGTAKLAPTLLAAITNGIVAAFAPRNRRVTIAVLVGGFIIAATNWFAMNQPAGETVMGLGKDSASGSVISPLYGGLATGIIAGFSRRPVYADARAGTFAAFAGMTMLMLWVVFARINGELPADSGFHHMGPISGTMFVLVVGFANTIVTFPVAFLVMFTSRSLIPNNKHRYGWLIDDDYHPELDYVTPGPGSSQGDLRSKSTAYSRFRNSPPRYSSIPGRFRDTDGE